MKRILITLVVIVLVFTSSALAEFDISVFNNSSTYTVEYDDMKGIYAITADWQRASDNQINPDGGSGLTLLPVILSFEGQSTIIGLLVKFYVYFGWQPVQSVIIKVDNVRYEFTRKGVSSTGDNLKKESFYLFLGEKALPIMEAIAEEPSSSVKVRLSSSSGHKDFELNSIAKDNMATIYNGYISAGGAEQTQAAIMNNEALATPVSVW